MKNPRNGEKKDAGHKLPEFPPELQPKKKEEECQVAVVTPMLKISDEQLRSAGERLGLSDLNRSAVQALHDLGIKAEEMGLVRSIHGNVLASQICLVGILGRLKSVMDHLPDEDIDNLRKCANAAANVASKLAGVNNSAVKADTAMLEAMRRKEEKRVPSFRPGEIVNAEILPEKPVVA